MAGLVRLAAQSSQAASYVLGGLGRIDIHCIHSMQHAMWMNARK